MDLKENILIIKKILKAKSIELYNHSIKTSKVLATLVHIANIHNYPLPITTAEATTLGLLHDIGKVYINDVIFFKQETLSKREWETMKLHPVWGKQFVQGTKFEDFGEYIIQHHEKIDGSGYPNKLKDKSIHEVSHMLSIADQLTSLMENRTYKRAIEDKTTLLTILEPNFIQIFGANTKNILSQSIDCILNTDEDTHSFMEINPPTDKVNNVFVLHKNFG